MQEDVFKHRLGQYPLLEMILQSLPVTSSKGIPKRGSFYMQRRTGGSASENYYGIPPPGKAVVSADETDAVVVDDQNHCRLFEELYNFGSIGCHDLQATTRDILLDGDITASWDATNASGVSHSVDSEYKVLEFFYKYERY
jgi:hypothetical protein